MPKLKVIGITGSFGKSSTKEFLHQILSQHFRVLKTPGNVNVDVGVAQIILKNLKPEHQIMIVEMGAYKIGEIKKIGDMVKPSIGVITAAQDQHLALFKSLENLKKAKFELIESLRKGGVGIFNMDNEGAADLAKRAKKRKDIKVITYGTNHSNQDHPITMQQQNQISPPQFNDSNVQAKNIRVQPEKVSFDIEGIPFSVPVAGKQTIPNLLAATIVARECGLSLGQIALTISHLKTPERTMELKSPQNNRELLLIDDSYNSNPEGVIAALEYLKILEGYFKIIIFPGMLELGEKSHEEHRRVAEKISEVCDYAIFTSKDFIKPLQEGLAENFKGKYKVIVGDQQEIMRDLDTLIKTQFKAATSTKQRKKIAILFESRGAEQVMQKLLI